MRRYECFCGKTVNIANFDHLWMLMLQKTVQKMESMLADSDAVDLFNATYKDYKEKSEETVLCPYCKGITIFELRVNRYATMYYLPGRKYETFPLEVPEMLKEFNCTCEKSVDTHDLQSQRTMIPEADILIEQVVQAFEDHEGVEDYYRRLYSVGRRVITCPHCLGITVVACDAMGNGLSGDYYAKKDEVVGEEFDIALLDMYR